MARRRGRIALRLFVLAGPALLSACAGGGCAASKLADLPLGAYHTLPLVTATINRAPVVLVLDTGAERTLLTSAAAARLGLGRGDGHAMLMRGIAGAMLNREARVRNLTFATMEMAPMTVMVAPTRLPEMGGVEPDGILGADVLAGLDLDLDMPRGRIAVYRAGGCQGDPPWSEPHATIAARRSGRNALFLALLLDGQSMQAEVDTGASVTTVTAAAALRAGLGPKTLSLDPAVPVRGANPRVATQRLHKFRSMTIGEDQILNPSLLVIGSHVSEWDVLLGSDYWRRKRVWLSFGTGRIFVAPPVGTRTP